MTTTGPTSGVIQAQVKAIRNKSPKAKAFGILAPGRWAGPAVLGTGNESLAVYQCDSPLQMRLALQQKSDAEAKVLVTRLRETEVSDDILVRLAMRRLHPLNSWETVRSLFKAKQLDPRITRFPFLAEMLLEQSSTRDFPPVVGGVLDAETVWDILLRERFGFTNAKPDFVELLRNSAEHDLSRRWKESSPEFRDAATGWIAETAGDAAATILSCIEREHGSKALSIGLTMGVVYHDQVGHELDKAAGRLETFVGTGNLSIDLAKKWRDAAGIAASQIPKDAIRVFVKDAEEILASIGAIEHAWRSDQLEAGFEQRLSRFGRALAAHIDARSTEISAELQGLRDSLMHHRLGREKNRKTERVTMAFRLARWLADQTESGRTSASNLVALSEQYTSDGGFVDWARRALRGGEPNKDLASAYLRLVERVTELREAENERFGRAIVEHRVMGDADAGLIPVEQVLDRVVAKAARVAPVLVLVADGMSWAVFRELIADIVEARKWAEVGFGSEPRRLTALAALPSVTEICRTSLLCGALRRGGQDEQIRGFAVHAALVAAGQSGREPQLFPKAELEAKDDTSLAGKVRDALADRKQRVVGIVVNAIDDHLDKGDQIDAVWTVQQIRVLAPILSEAGAAGRLIILVSDHGHILDRQTEGRELTDGQRWRRPGGGLVQGELEAASPRVLLPEGGRVVVPWTEQLRYGQKKNGYHGGITPQEMLIPISLLWAGRETPEGMSELPAELRSWWEEPERTVPKPSTESLTPQVSMSVKAPTLFDLPQTTTRSVSSLPKSLDDAWITLLLTSEVYAGQKRLAGRARIDDQTVERLLLALISRGGSMTAPALAGAISVPEHRLPGMLAIMQRLLNVEGYAILDRQDASNTVVFNIALAKKQFELGG